MFSDSLIQTRQSSALTLEGSTYHKGEQIYQRTHGSLHHPEADAQ